MRTHLDLFSGIGGFALAANWAGFTTVGFVEYEDFPKRLLSRRFPGIPIHSDIHDFDATPFRGVDLVTGGYPCQPFSQAGKRKGKEDDRHLWPEMFRVITQARPSWVLAENVAGHINLGLDEVLLDLESEGYTCRTVVLPACAKNALHRRDRVWIIAKRNAGDTDSSIEGEIGEIQGRQSDTESRGVCTAASGESRSDVAHTDSTGTRLETHRGGGQKRQSASTSESALLSQGDRSSCTEGSGASGNDVAHSQGNGLQGGRVRDKGSEHSEEVGQGTAESIGAGAGSSSRDVAHSDSKRGRSRNCQWQDAEDAGQSSRGAEHGTGIIKPRLGGSLDGIPKELDFPRRWGDGTWEDGIPRVTTQKKGRTQRLKALGNAIVPQVAYEIIRHFD